MGQGTKIAWATDTLNAWIGCTKIAHECQNCYAAEQDRRRFSKTLGEGTAENPVRHWGNGQPRHLTNALKDRVLERWNSRPLVCDKCGQVQPAGSCVTIGQGCIDTGCSGSYERRRVFIGSLMDWADEEVPNEWRDWLFDQADKATSLRLLFLTKRGRKAWEYLTRRYPSGCPDHFWIGFSYLHEKPDALSLLVNIRAKVRFVSCEPLLDEPLLSTRTPYGFPTRGFCAWNYLGPVGEAGIQWVIMGGESGPKARPCNLEHIRSGVQQCRKAGAIPFVKQIGRNPTWSDKDMAEKWYERFSDPKGGNPAEWPEDLRVQEIPA